MSDQTCDAGSVPNESEPFVPAGFEQLLVEHSAKTEFMTVQIGDAPFDPATATMFGIDIVPE